MNERKLNESEFISEVIEKIKYLLKAAILNKESNIRQSFRFSHNAKTNTKIIFCTFEEIDYLNNFIHFILNYNNFNNVYSTKYLDEQIINILHSTLDDTGTVPSEVKLLYDKLKKDSRKKWFILSEIANIKVSASSSFRLIDCTIKMLSKEDIPLGVKDISTYSIKECIAKPCIFTTVIAGDVEKAKNLAFQNFSQSFNLLRLYFPFLKPAIKGMLHSGNYTIYSFIIGEEKVNVLNSTSGDSKFQPIYLNETVYSYLQYSGINDLENNNSITKVVRNCLHWYGMGLDEELQSAKLLNYITVFESVLKKQSESTELKQRVSDRCALLLKTTFTERKMLAEHISKIYNERNKVVHTGVIINDENIAETAGFYAREVLIQLIKANAECKGNFEEFINNIDDKKYY